MYHFLGLLGEIKYNMAIDFNLSHLISRMITVLSLWGQHLLETTRTHIFSIYRQLLHSNIFEALLMITKHMWCKTNFLHSEKREELF